MRAQHSRGVTLVELIVTLAILSLLLMVAAPNVSAWVRNTQIRNVATSILTGVQRARAEAIRRNAPMRFSLVSLSDSSVMDGSCKLSEAGVAWVVSQDNPAGLCGVAVSETTAPRIVDKHASGSGGKWVTVNGNQVDGKDAHTLIFNGFGRSAGPEPISWIDIDNDTPGPDYRALRIVIGAGGTVRMCEPGVTNASDPRKC
nr:GspH/FimT family pseudopilin [uncultured Roseateles sp.]